MISTMEGLTISKVAEETGFSPSALRFYEGHGLITPARTRAGYRTYDPASVETLRFIARAKRLGLSLDEIRDLVVLLDDRRCAPVQGEPTASDEIPIACTLGAGEMERRVADWQDALRDATRRRRDPRRDRPQGCRGDRAGSRRRCG